MGLKQYIDSVLGHTSSSNVSIVEKTHVLDDSFRKVVDIKRSIDERRKEAKNRNMLFPHKVSHKLDTLEYRFTFSLNTVKRPNNYKIVDLIDASIYNRNYKVFTELFETWPLRILGPNDNGYRTRFRGYKLCDWLEIETEFVDGGEVVSILGNDVKVFEASYESIGELGGTDGGKNTLLIQTIDVKDSQVDKFVQQIVRAEQKIYLRECLKMMSPN